MPVEVGRPETAYTHPMPASSHSSKSRVARNRRRRRRFYDPAKSGGDWQVRAGNLAAATAGCSSLLSKQRAARERLVRKRIVVKFLHLVDISGRKNFVSVQLRSGQWRWEAKTSEDAKAVDRRRRPCLWPNEPGVLRGKFLGGG